MRLATLSVLAMLLVLPLGCVQADQAYLLMPDGSGKLTLKFAFGAQMMAMAKAQGSEPFDPDPREMERDFEGFVAFSEPVLEEGKEWTTVTLTGWFEDINKVKWWQSSPGGGAGQDGEDGEDGEDGGGMGGKGGKGGKGGSGGDRKLTIAFKYEVKGAGGELTVDDGMTASTKKDMSGDGPEAEMAKGMLQGMKPMLKGFKFTTSLVLPGAVTEAGGAYAKDGRKATFTFDEELLVGLIDGKEEAKKKIEKQGQGVKIAWATTDVPAAEQDAFKKDLAAAKAKWVALRADLIKKADARKAAKAEKEKSGGDMK